LNGYHLDSFEQKQQIRSDNFKTTQIVITVKSAQEITSIKQSPALKGHLFLCPKGDFLIQV
jgi:hypothetical protein